MLTRNLFRPVLMRGRGATARLLGQSGWVLGSVLIAICALAVCGYQYGMYDQGQYLVQVVDLEHPGHLGDDPYTGVFRSLRSVVWVVLATVTTEGTRPLVSLLVTIGIVSTNVVLLGVILSRLMGWRVRTGRTFLIAAGLPALMLVVPKEQNWFGLVSLGDLELTATLVVMPFVFGSILAWVTRRRGLALALSVAAIAIQGQTGVYLVVAWAVASVAEGLLERRLPVGAFVVVGIGAILASVEVFSGAVSGGQLDAYEQVGLDLYAPLINPLVAPWTAWAATAVLLAMGTAACVASRRAGATTVISDRLIHWTLASLAFPILGLILLAAGVRDPLLWKLMIGRSFMLPQLIAVVFVAEWCIRMLASGSIRTVTGATIAVAVVVWPFPTWSTTMAVLALGTLLVLLATLVPHAVSWTNDVARRRAAFGTLGAMACVLGIAVPSALGRVWVDAATDDWTEAQSWAARHSDPGDVFITPPYRCGWRLGALRPTFGELKDGGLTFYAGEPVVEWAERMDLLGMEAPYRWIESAAQPVDAQLARSYSMALASNLELIRTRATVRFVVTEREADLDVGTPVWSNGSFVIRELPSDASVARARLASASASE